MVLHYLTMRIPGEDDVTNMSKHSIFTPKIAFRRPNYNSKSITKRQEMRLHADRKYKSIYIKACIYDFNNNYQGKLTKDTHYSYMHLFLHPIVSKFTQGTFHLQFSLSAIAPLIKRVPLILSHMHQT